MGNTFEEIQTGAEGRWRSLTADPIPWIRIGNAICGKAAGADQVIDAVRGELRRHDIEASVSEVGCLGLCYAEPLLRYNVIQRLQTILR